MLSCHVPRQAFGTRQVRSRGTAAPKIRPLARTLLTHALKSSQYNYIGLFMEKAISAADANRKFSPVLREVREGQSYVGNFRGCQSGIVVRPHRGIAFGMKNQYLSTVSTNRFGGEHHILAPKREMQSWQLRRLIPPPAK